MGTGLAGLVALVGAPHQGFAAPPESGNVTIREPRATRCSSCAGLPRCAVTPDELERERVPVVRGNAEIVHVGRPLRGDSVDELVQALERREDPPERRVRGSLASPIKERADCVEGSPSASPPIGVATRSLMLTCSRSSPTYSQKEDVAVASTKDSSTPSRF